MHNDFEDATIETGTDNPWGDFPRYTADAEKDTLDKDHDQQIQSTETAAADTTGLEESSESVSSLGNECTAEMFRCVTDGSGSPHILSDRAGYSRRENRRRILPRWKPGSVITYSVDVNSFPTRKPARFAERALDKAAVPNGIFFAESFFPDSKRRTLSIFKNAFKRNYRKFMSNILRHELGHVLGLRHEEAGTMESRIPSVALTTPNGRSIMRYFRDPSSLCIQESDVAAVKKIETGSHNRSIIKGLQPGAISDGLASVVTPPQTSPTVEWAIDSTVTTDPEPYSNNHEQAQLMENALQEPRSTIVVQDYSFLAVPLYLQLSSSSIASVEESLVLDNSNDKHIPQSAPFQLDLQDALTPDIGFEDKFSVESNPFAFSPGQLGKMFAPKSHNAFSALGGLHGLEKGLRTDITSGLSMDETTLEGMVSFEEGANEGASKYDALGEKVPHMSHSEYRRPEASYTPPENSIQGSSDTVYSDRSRVFGSNRIPGLAMKRISKILFDIYCVFSSFVLRLLISIRISQRHLEKLRRMNDWRLAKVIPSGRTLEVSIFDLLVKDVALLSAGDLVPIDGILIDGHGLKFDESCSTGESDIIRKTPGDQVFSLLEDAVNDLAHESPWRMDPFIIS
ncbi:ATPase P-type K Mg Cd Cu Zn Na Ca Na H-transporter [Fusarium beomiforme]|uniref:ATPase P-type K Mg Cd Cu Zn Na Ca Na H-transporter n=1 Tax=Fusarium beomiforme TaxID=44412 RepID=A0A9P5DSJ5_9HYPO|nr:ATPase P-type K Mg Cd Cu Zn Na Ca Na H-transporter [Fusarium beomiforme]